MSSILLIYIKTLIVDVIQLCKICFTREEGRAYILFIHC